MIRGLSEQLIVLLSGQTVILTVAALASAAWRDPSKRQKWGETTIACTLLWWCIILLPLPRWSPTGREPSGAASTVKPLSRTGDLPAPLVRRDEKRTIRAKANGQDDRPGSSALLQRSFPAARGASPVGPAGPGSSLRSLATLLLLAGGGSCLLWLVIGRWRLWRLERRCRAAEPWLESLLDKIAGTDHRVRPRLLVTEHEQMPIVFGLWRPRIVLPHGWCRPDKIETLRSVLLHELAHIRRGDGWGQLLVNLALPLNYFHPLYWMVRGQVTFCRELLADDWAVGHINKRRYIQQLIGLLRAAGPYSAAPSAIGFYSRQSRFYRRMKMLISRSQPLASRPSARWTAATSWSMLAAVTAIGFSIGVPLTSGQSRTAKAVDRAPSQSKNKNPKRVKLERSKGRDETRTKTLGQSGERRGLTVLLTAKVDVRVSPRIDGHLTAVGVQPGARVKAGQLLGQLDDTRAKVNRGGLDGAERSLAQLVLERDLAKAEADSAKSDYARAGQLGPAVSRAERGRIELKYQTSRLRLKLADAKHREAIAHFKRDMRLAEDELTNHRIIAPVDGIVESVTHRKGEFIKRGQTFARVINPSRLLAQTHVRTSDYDLSKLNGREVLITVRNDKGLKIKGKVVYVSSIVNAVSATVEIRAEFENPEKGGRYLLRPGQRARMKIR